MILQSFKHVLYLLFGLHLFAGCKMMAPMHVWNAAEVPKTGHVRVAVAPIGGPEDASQKLLHAMERAQPQPSPLVAAVYPDELTKIGGIQLVSFDNQPNDMATVAAARRAGMDYVLVGNILDCELDIPTPNPLERKRFQIFKPKQKTEHMSVRWTIIDASTGTRVKEQVTSLDRKQAEKLYPDMAIHTAGNDGRVLLATARQGWSIVGPTLTQTQATLDLPWFSLGASQVRKGNGYARQGNWEAAENQWQGVAKEHPHSKAAWKNLSLAAVAREDFQLARDRLKHADSFLPGDSTFSTLTWIEHRQRNYHKAFGIDPPREGWTLADAPPSVGPDEVPSSPPKDLKDMPWWTVIPVLPPPGWTWKQWWTQPIVF